jgi:hypothetical protein
VARRITGQFWSTLATNNDPKINGVFKIERVEIAMLVNVSGGGIHNPTVWSIDSSLGVPTGSENSPRTIAMKYWRRVA